MRLETQHQALALTEGPSDPSVLNLIPAALARRHRAMPLARTLSGLVVAFADPADGAALDAIAAFTGLPIEPVTASAGAIDAALQRHYGGETATDRSSDADPMVQALADLRLDDEDRRSDAYDRPERDASGGDRQTPDAPVSRLVNALLLSALHRGASDIHLEPYERELRVRFRVDGVLQPVPGPPWRYREALASRIKIMAQLDIAEKRLPQDGRFQARLGAAEAPRDLDVRVSTLPTLFGEKLVLRLLDRERVRLDLAELGFSPMALRQFEAAIRRPWGLVLVTGPTGSGKTNTLYSAIAQLHQPGVNIVTAEDPIEVHVPGITQVAVREQIGLTFAATLRAFLRQDPNIILVGEIRDNETAAMAVKAAMTGHLVLSTLHTSDAPGAISRLVHMGVAPVLLTGALSLVCAQRLVRRVCAACAVPAVITADDWHELGLVDDLHSDDAPRRGVGCGQCGHTGYRGRVGLFEVMPLSDRLRTAVLAGADTSVLRAIAMDEGMVPLRQQGLRAVRAGLTTVEDVRRETVSAC